MTRILSFSAMILLVVFTSDFTLNTSRDGSRFHAKHAPSDHYDIMRSYPDEHVDIDGYEQALAQAKISANNGMRSEGFDLEWTIEGPGNIGARINAIAVPTNKKDTIYIGYARGGIFRTYNGGIDWEDIFADENKLAIGSIAINPLDDQVIYAGTGDKNIPGLFSIGDGIYKSSDGGDTWNNKGLTDQRVISDIAINPIDTDVIYTACMGLPSVPSSDRGVYKSSDGGDTWNQVLYINDSTGINNVVVNPNNPDIIYASGWTRIRTNQVSVYYGAGSSIWKSSDAGANWTELTNGLPGQGYGRTGITMFPSNPDTLYALYVDVNSQLLGVYRTMDGGSNWASIPTVANGVSASALGGFGWYFSGIYVNPYDYEDLFFEGVQLWRTNNGGSSWDEADPPWWTYEVHADKHDMYFLDENEFLLATDGGLYRTTDDASNWTKIEQNKTNEFYRVAHSPMRPTRYYGGMQDNGSTGGNASINNWPRIYGGDGFQMKFHPTDSTRFFAETQNGNIVYTTNNGGGFSGVGSPTGNERTNWDTPYLLSHANPSVMYSGSYRVHRDAASPFGSWTTLSGDLTDGNIFGNPFHTISSLDESPVNDSILYVGTSDANVWRSLDRGASWDSLHSTLPNRYVTCVRASPNADSVAYVTHSGYKYNDYVPHIHRSMDNGDTWTDIAGDMPNLAVNDLIVYPGYNDSVLFVGTDGGVYGTTDAGFTWERVGTNMPMIATNDLELDTVNNRLIAGTNGRSIMTYPLDSIVSVPIDTSTPLALTAYLDIMDVQCQGQNSGSMDVIITSGNAPYTYAWSTGATTSNITSLAPGAYTVTVTDVENQQLVLSDSVHLDTTGAAPVIGPLVGPVSVQAWTSYNYSVSPTSGSIFIWIADGGVVTSSTSNAATIQWNAGPLGEVKVIESNLTGCQVVDSFEVSIQFVGIQSVDLERISVFPNPADQVLNVNLPEGIAHATLKVFGMDGRLSMERSMQSSNYQLDLANLSAGHYVLDVAVDNASHRIPFIVR